jgi:hypothetical protein
MGQIIIELDELTPDLTPGEYLFLKVIYDGNLRGYKALCTTYPTFVLPILESLQKKMYIKIMGDDFKELVIREEAEKLFSKEEDITFEEFWKKYHSITKLKATDKAESERYWKRLKKEEKKIAVNNIEGYFQSTRRDNLYYTRKAKYYLEYKLFNDEFNINNTSNRITAR